MKAVVGLSWLWQEQALPGNEWTPEQWAEWQRWQRSPERCEKQQRGFIQASYWMCAPLPRQQQQQQQGGAQMPQALQRQQQARRCIKSRNSQPPWAAQRR